MNQKITFPELVSAISESTGFSKYISEEFLKELFALVASKLVEGENVKIKKLGTFKVIDVDARKSVKVGTGEEIEIPEHRKISFTPDKELAEAIATKTAPKWLDIDAANLSAKVNALPAREDIDFPFTEQLIGELYSK